MRSEQGPLFTKSTDVLSQDLVKSRRREIGCNNDRIALKFDKHLGSSAEVPAKFQSDWNSLNMNLTALRFLEILRQDLRLLSEEAKRLFSRQWWIGFAFTTKTRSVVHRRVFCNDVSASPLPYQRIIWLDQVRCSEDALCKPNLTNIKRTFGNHSQRSLFQNAANFVLENVFENVDYKLAAILCSAWCVNRCVVR